MKTTLVLLMAVLAFQTPPRNATSAVQGTVTRADSDEPIAGVRITLGDQFAATTDDAGRFNIGEIPPSIYNVGIFRDGFLVSEAENSSRTNNVVSGMSFRGGNLPVAQSAGQLTVSAAADTSLHFRMVPEGAISGRVLAPNGAPASALQIYVMQTGYWNGQKRSLLPVGTAQTSTDDRGEFRIYWLMPGEYFVVGYDLRSSRTTTYFPGTTEMDKAEVIQVKGGEETAHINFSMTSGPPRTIKGNLNLSVSGVPESGIVTAIPQDTGVPVGPSYAFDWRPGRNNQTLGEFKIGTLPPPILTTAFDLFAVGVSKGVNYFGHASIPAGDRGVEGIQIVLHAGVDVSGHVTFQPGIRGQPVSSLPIDLQSMTRVPFETACHGNPLEFACRDKSSLPALASNGNFLLRSIPDGTFGILPNLPQGMYLADVRQAGKSIIDSGLKIEDGKRPNPIEVIVSPNGATLEGVLIDKDLNPVPLTRVVLVPEEARWQNMSLFRSVRTDHIGRFAIDGIPPGKYEVFGWLNVSDGSWTNPGFLETQHGNGTGITLKEGEQLAAVRVSLIP